MKKAKQTRQLPTRGGLNDLGKSERTLADYAKSTPLDVAKPTPGVMQNLARPKPKR
jgi:hypothetical protein